MKKLSAIIFAIMACVVLVLMPGLHVQAATTINNGIYIDGQNVSGMSSDEVKKMVQDKIDLWGSAVLTFTSPTGYKLMTHPTDLGLEWANADIVEDALTYCSSGNVLQRYKASKDIERNNVNFDVEIKFDKRKIERLITDNLEKFNQEAVNSQLSKSDSGIAIKAGKPGVIIDDNAVNIAYDYLVSEWDGNNAIIELASVIDQPMGDDSDLTKLTDVIGTFTTEYKKSSEARCTNVANGCRLLDGVTLYPGEQFSVLEHLVPFTEANGYKPAGSYMNGLVVDTLGGGICQVSSTLYNAVLLAELQVDERSNHSMIVDYVPPSGDAAIAESSGKDFKFTNNKDFPIYIEGYVTEDKTITFNIYGIETRPENRVVSFKSEVTERTVADYESIIQDAGKPIGYTSVTSSHAGIKAKYYKIVTVDGVEESVELVNNSTYKMVPRTIVVGVGTDNADAYNQIQAAIATGSVDQVRATAKALAAQSSEPAPQAAPAGDP